MSNSSNQISLRVLAIGSGLLSALLFSACGGGGDGAAPTTPAVTSADITYTSATVLSSNVNHVTAIDAAPEISSDYLELYFHSDRSGNFDIYVATRTDVSQAWGVATAVAELNTASNDVAPALSSDGLTMIFASNRAGGQGGNDLYVSTRAMLNAAWSTPANIGGLNTAAAEAGPSLSDDGLSLYFHSDAAGGFGNTDIYVSTRASLAANWGAPVNLGTNVNSVDFDLAPDIASDGLSLYFHTTRTGGPGGAHDIWRSTRASTSDPWQAAQAVAAPVNSMVSDLAPSLSDDWQSIYYASDTGGNRDIWEANP